MADVVEEDDFSELGVDEAESISSCGADISSGADHEAA